METLDIWSDVHPSLVTLPMDWGYEIPYGVTYSERPSPTTTKFLDALRRHLEEVPAATAD
ncbi:MAG: hypothetical protein HDQ87_01555 [Clostridia bacterium]|nr:hypothetical protein [Clostridia bacterium]